MSSLNDIWTYFIRTVLYILDSFSLILILCVTLHWSNQRPLTIQARFLKTPRAEGNFIRKNTLQKTRSMFSHAHLNVFCKQQLFLKFGAIRVFVLNLLSFYDVSLNEMQNKLFQFCRNFKLRMFDVEISALLLNHFIILNIMPT